MVGGGETWRTGLVSLVLVAITLAVFSRVGDFGFLTYDDEGYVTANAIVRQGLSGEGLAWAFTALHEANWHPLTWLSHMADCQFFGLDPRGHHLTNLLFHLANTLLLFSLLRRLTGAFWQSAVVALLFAVHPLHVESVAWVAERKDLLSALFWFLALHAYCRYVDRPAAGGYLLVFFLFLCGLLSKPMIVTLPCVLLLLDWWPLRRVGRVAAGRLIAEKIPFFLGAAASATITVIAQKKGDALTSLDQIPLVDRLANVPVAYFGYLKKMFWPADLAVFYPFVAPPGWQVAGALITLAVITVVAFRRRGLFLFGWLWFLGILVPVIGIVQVGEQAMADRYTYLSLIGPFLMLVWGVAEASRSFRFRAAVLVALTAVVAGSLGFLSWRQSGYWEDSYTLFTRAAAVTNNNYLALNNIGTLYAQQGLSARGDEYYREALRMNPRYANAWYNLGVSLEAAGRLPEAEHYFAEAARLKPAFAEAHYNLGVVLVKEGRLREAGARFEEALRLNPDFPGARNNLEVATKLLQNSSHP